MTQAAGYFGYATDGSRFYVIGGLGNEGYLDYTQVYDISSGVWSVNNGIVYSEGIGGNAAVFLDGSLHSVGGYNNGSTLSIHRMASLCGVYTFSGLCYSTNQCILNTSCSGGECTGQSKLCLNSNCIPTSGQCLNSTTPISSSISSGEIVGIVISIVVVGVIIVLAVVLFLKYKRKRKINGDNSAKTILKEVVPNENYKLLNEVQILEKIGGGNFGEVYYGKWNGTTKASEHFEEFVQEASMLQSLNHPNIVRFFGIHTTSNREHFLVMEYMRKGSLDGVLQTEEKQIFFTRLACYRCKRFLFFFKSF